MTESIKSSFVDLFNVLGLEEQRIEFDGSGDSGDCTLPPALLDLTDVPIPVLVIGVQSGWWLPGNLPRVYASTVDGLLEALFDATIYSGAFPDWQNNEGGFGEIRIDPVSRTIEVTCNVRYTDVESHNFTF